MTSSSSVVYTEVTFLESQILGPSNLVAVFTEVTISSKPEIFFDYSHFSCNDKYWWNRHINLLVPRFGSKYHNFDCHPRLSTIVICVDELLGWRFMESRPNLVSDILAGSPFCHVETGGMKGTYLGSWSGSPRCLGCSLVDTIFYI